MLAEHTCNRLRFLRALGLGAVALALPRCATSAAAASAKKRPTNILLIVSDDQGYNDLGCYGGEEILTPNQDRLAREGVRLTNFYVAWPACTPSRGSFLTGRYPQRNGTYDMYRNEKPDYGYKYPPEEYAVTPERILGMDVREVLLPRVLKQAGYTSGIYGKWDLGQLQRFLTLQRGFDILRVRNTGIDYYTTSGTGYRRCTATMSPPRGQGRISTWCLPAGQAVHPREQGPALLLLRSVQRAAHRVGAGESQAGAGPGRIQSPVSKTAERTRSAPRRVYGRRDRHGPRHRRASGTPRRYWSGG